MAMRRLLRQLAPSAAGGEHRRAAAAVGGVAVPLTLRKADADVTSVVLGWNQKPHPREPAKGIRDSDRSSQGAIRCNAAGLVFSNVSLCFPVRWPTASVRFGHGSLSTACASKGDRECICYRARNINEAKAWGYRSLVWVIVNSVARTL